MDRRTGLNNNLSYNNPIDWVVFLLRSIGRATYKSIFFICKLAYKAFSHLISFVKTLNLQFKVKTKKVIHYPQSKPVVITPNPQLKKFFKKLALFNLGFIFFATKIIEKIKTLFNFKFDLTFLNLNLNQTKLKILLKKLYLNFGLTFLSPIKILRFKLVPSYATMFSLLLLTLTTAGGFYYFILKDLPNPNELITRQTILTTKIYARDGSLLYKIYRNQNRSLVKLENIPPHLINATIAAEDKDFWSHPGFSVRGIIRAAQKNFNNEASMQGGSTITQQLVKNALLSSERTYTRKLKELVLAIEVELMFSKEEILQMYFNEIPYGGIAYGAEEAAQTYFGKSVKNLNLAESALLAGLPTAPTRYSPFGAHPEYSIYRQHQVLNAMYEEGLITQDQKTHAKTSKIALQTLGDKISAPHFVMYVKDFLVQKYGTRIVEEGGLEVYTSLDPKIQALAEQAVRQEVDKLIPMRVTNGATLVTNPQTGEVLAMVGSRDYFDTEHDGNVNVTMRLRQPGSAIKPLTYALALQSGFTPVSIIQDSPISYPDGQRPYVPVNYDNQFHGPVTLRTALGSSFNIPAVKILHQLGVQNLITFAETMGISTWQERNRFGLSLTLGGGEVRMTELIVAYGVFANQGYRVDLNPILQVKNIEGKTLLDSDSNTDFSIVSQAQANNDNVAAEAVINPLIAYQISDILSDNRARIPAFGPNSLLNIPGHQVAVKTGTTNDKRDNWAVGYTPNHAVAVWVGNNDNTPMSAVASGITGATPIWHNVMTGILEEVDQPIAFSPPQNLVPIQVCKDYGVTTCLAGCQNLGVEYFVPGNIPQIPCPPPPKEGENKPEHLTAIPQ